MQFCPKCGAAWRQNARFCTNCGYRLSADAENPNAGFLDPNAQSVKKPQKKQLSGGSRAVRSLVSVVLCLILFSALIGGMAIASVRIAASRLVVSAVVYSMDIDKIYLDRPDVIMADELYGELDAAVVAYYNITKEDLIRFIDRSTMRAFLSEVLGNFASDIFDDNGKGVLTVDDIEVFLFDNAGVMEQELGYQLDESDRALIRQRAEDALGGERLSLDEALNDEMDDWTLGVLRRVFSYGNIAILFGTALLCAVGIFFLWLGYFVPFSRFVGVPLVVAGALYLLGAAFVLLLPPLFGAAAGISSKLFGALIGPPGIGIGLLALLVLLIGAILLAVGTRIRKRA